MNWRAHLYDFKNLAAYAAQRKKGQYQDALEQIIAEDELLQTVIAGMEQGLEQHSPKDLVALMDQKKKQQWSKLQGQLLATNGHVATNPSQPWYRTIANTWQELQQAQFQYIFGLNCTCFLALVAFCFWIRFGSEQPDLISFVDFPEGFKP